MIPKTKTEVKEEEQALASPSVPGHSGTPGSGSGRDGYGRTSRGSPNSPLADWKKAAMASQQNTWKSTQRLYRLIKPHSLPSAARAAGELRDKVGRYLGSHFTREVLPTAFESGAACEKSAAPILVTAAALVRSEEPRDRALGTSIASTFAEIWQSQQSCNTALNSMMISLIEEEQQQQQQQLDPPSSLHPSNTLPALSTVQSLPSDERPPPLGSKLPETDGQKWSAIKKTMDCLGRQQRTVTVSDSPSLTLGTGAGAESLTPMVETGLKRRQNASTSGSSSTRTPRSSLRPKSSLTGKCRQSA